MLVTLRRNAASYFEASSRSRPRAASGGWGRRAFTRSPQGFRVKTGMCKYSQRELVPGEQKHIAVGHTRRTNVKPDTRWFLRLQAGHTLIEQ